MAGCDTEVLVVTASMIAIGIAVTLRGWALYRGWFYADDYVLLHESQEASFGLGHLMEPYTSQLMPGGRFLVSLAGDASAGGYLRAAGQTVILTLVAGAAALWMLITAFGRRWAVLGLLTVYLTTAMTMQATLWWAAALNQVPLQVSFFLAVGAWLRYLRSNRWGWLLLTLFAVAFGLAFYVKTLLVLPVLAFLAVAYFAEGPLPRRVLDLVRQRWAAAALILAVGVGYSLYYAARVDTPFNDTSPSVAGTIADSMIGTAFASAVVGGPWRWSDLTAPTALAEPPTVAVHLAWVGIALTVIYVWLRRRASLRAWLLLGGYVIASWLLLVNSRAPLAEEIAGLQYRYLTDVACVLALSLGLATLPLVGAQESSSPRRPPVLLAQVPRAAVVLIVCSVTAMSATSSLRYAQIWIDSTAGGRSYIHNLQDGLRAGSTDLVDTYVPPEMQYSLIPEENRLSLLANLISDNASFPEASPRLMVVDDDGKVHQAIIGDAVTARTGPNPDCGWPVDDTGRTIPLTQAVGEGDWWLRIGYLAQATSPVEVSAGPRTVATEVLAGLNSLYVEIEGPFEAVRITGLDEDVQVCVDTIEVGAPIPRSSVP